SRSVSTTADGLMSRNGSSCCFCFSSSSAARSGDTASLTWPPASRTNSNVHGTPPQEIPACGFLPPSPRLSSPHLEEDHGDISAVSRIQCGLRPEMTPRQHVQTDALTLTPKVPRSQPSPDPPGGGLRSQRQMMNTCPPGGMTPTW